MALLGIDICGAFVDRLGERFKGYFGTGEIPQLYSVLITFLGLLSFISVISSLSLYAYSLHIKPEFVLYDRLVLPQ